MNESKLDFIFRRRSIRRFSGREVGEVELRQLLEAAMSAPSAMCRDPWHFVVIRSREKREAVAGALAHGKFVAEAPLAIVVCGDLEQAHDHSLSYLLQDVSASMENLLLAAAALDLGGCWLGVHPREERIAALRRLCRLPENILPVAVAALGYPEERREPRSRFAADHVHCECWEE